MAVVQISRIQVRRGKVAAGSSVPQLASGELAWAIDSQELWIGNGSVAEGAPSVGNTKILTLNDLSANGNILGVIQYIYQINVLQTSTSGITARPVQQRLDDTVTSSDFGTLGNGVLTTDQSGYQVPIGSAADGPSLQLAINQLYLNALPANSLSGVTERYVLIIPPGVYILPSTLFIPSYVTLNGAGSDKTIFYYTGNSTAITHTANTGGALGSYTVILDSVAGLVNGMNITGTGVTSGALISTINALTNTVTMSLPASAQISGQLVFNKNTLPAIQFVNDSFDTATNTVVDSPSYQNQPRDIHISGITVWTALGTNAAFQMDNVRDSSFTDVYFKGNASVPLTPSTSSIALQMNAFSSVTTTQHVTFRDCKFENFYAMINAKGDIRNITWDNCYFLNSQFGFLFGIDSNGVIADGSTPGQQYGPRQCIITACKFNHINEQALLIESGNGNVIENAKFVNVGSLGQAYNVGLIQYPQIYFGVPGNKAVTIYSDRSALLSDSVNTTIPYIAEVSGYTTYSPYSTSIFNIVQQTNSSLNPLFRLPAKCDVTGSPTGTIIYTIDYIYASTNSTFSRKGQLTIVADVTHIQTQLSDDYIYAGPNGITDALDLDFTVSFIDSSGIKYTGAQGQTPYGIGIYYTNNLAGDTGILTVDYTSVS
jgi:hypothetical protein